MLDDLDVHGLHGLVDDPDGAVDLPMLVEGHDDDGGALLESEATDVIVHCLQVRDGAEGLDGDAGLVVELVLSEGAEDLAGSGAVGLEGSGGLVGHQHAGGAADHLL